MRLTINPWIVVRRHIKDRKSKGEITHSNLSQETAERIADQNKERSLTHNYWAMPRCKYDTPFAEEGAR
jgi:hypothetical protein